MKNTLTFILLLFFSFFASATDFMFRHLDVKDGLSNNQINHIYKDSEGYMWFSTASGLTRYNGNQMDVFRSYDLKEGPLVDNYVCDVQEDSTSCLWVHCSGGYSIFDPETETFDRDIPERLKRIGVDKTPNLIFIDGDKNMWFYHHSEGIRSYLTATGELSLIGYGREALPEGEISTMSECDEGILLLYKNGTIVCLNKKGKGILWISYDIAREFPAGTAEFFAAFVDQDNDLWIYGPLGVWIYRLNGKTWDNRLKSLLTNQSYNMIRAIAQDIQGRIWIGKDQDGIDILDKQTLRIRHLRSQTGDARSLSNNTINSLFVDKNRCMWVGTYKKGISYYNESAFKFGVDHVGDINCIQEDGDGIVWLGTNDAGLVRWNMQTGQKECFSQQAGNGLAADVVVCLLKSRDRKLWVGTFWGGLDCYANGKFTHYRHIPGDPNSLAHNNVWGLVEDPKGNIWIGTLGGGVQCFNPTTGRFKTFNVANANLLSDFITSLCLTRNNTLLVGSPDGISVFDTETERLSNTIGVSSGKSLLSNQNINHIYEDSRGLWWIATRDWLNVYDPKTDNWQVITQQQGLPGPFIAGIIEDNNKNMWISTSCGITNVMVGKDSKNGEYAFRCYAYDEKEGLLNCEFNQRSFCKLKSGEILVGGLYGVNRLIPDQIKYNQSHPKVLFSHLTLFNEEVHVGQEYDGRVILPKVLNRIGTIELNYKQNIFSIQVSSDNHVLPEKMKYSYKLEGFNDEWFTSEAGKITYTNLAPGAYRLKVRAENSDGYGSDQDASLRIVIHPPFWLTIWAYLFYMIVLCATLLWARYLLLKGERDRFKVQQIEQEALKNQEINDMKLRFFTNVSHELRTPLTLILSPLDTLIKEYETDDALSDRLKMIQRNGVRLLNLVNQLLDFRKGDVNGHHLCLSEGDVVEFVGTICTSFKALSDKKNVHLTFFSTLSRLVISFDGDKIGKVVMNLLSNAFKFTPEGGRVDVSVAVVPDESGEEILEIKVSDTGIGISDEDKKHIFERFYQVDHPEATGSGIGLNIVRDFVLLHKGEVGVYDNVPAGTVFIVHLPLRRAFPNPVSDLQLPDTCPADISGVDDGHEHMHQIGGQSDQALQPGDKRPMLMIVDDNDDFLTFMYDSLRTRYRVRIATNGREAWEVIPQLQPDIIISDVMMPEMDGQELCKCVKTTKQTAHIPFILLTARQSNEHRLEGLTCGAEDYISKPFNMDILLLRVNKLLSLRPTRSLAQIDPAPSEIQITSLDEKLIENAVKCVEKNMDRSDFSVEELSQELGMSRVHLYKKLLAITHKTPIEFIRIIRLKRAAQLLRESQQNVSEIAYQVGFNNPKYFSKYFKEEYGELPSVYQEREGR